MLPDSLLGAPSGTTSLFEHRDEKWIPTMPKGTRDISTVIVDETEKEALLKDAERFLRPEAKSQYSKHGISYKRGYLFHGPPGTGKSSLGLSIAGHLTLDIYVLTVFNTNDKLLSILFSALPRKCIVPLEDVDAAFTARSRDEPAVLTAQAEQSKLTPSGLLNVLDGAASPKGRILIMTTNYIDRLDQALVRLGRADRKMEFQLADRTMPRQLFWNIIEDGDALAGLADDFTTKLPRYFNPPRVKGLRR